MQPPILSGRSRWAVGSNPGAGSASGFERLVRARQICRVTIIFLISAIALAGFRPFGQTCAQFMMVWQR